MEEGEIEREGWGLLLARLASEKQRMEATPAELLLDQAMRTMLPQASKMFDRRKEVGPGCASSQSLAPTCFRSLRLLQSSWAATRSTASNSATLYCCLQETQALLQQAFTLPDARQDVFSMVAGLAEGECCFGHSCRPARQSIIEHSS